ncbi:hypothetical protein ACVIWV_006015 [Bradyrhizobium diazoefficiens]
MSDRHIRRAGSDYRDAFLELLPQGQAWPKHSIDSTLWQACDGLNNYWPRGSVKIPRVWSLETPPPDDRRQRR